MKLPSTANSIDKIANLGSTERISRKLILYEQSNCKIIAIEKPTTGNNGKLILLGDADSTSDGLFTNADVVILTSRELVESNEFTLGVQPSYDSTSKITTLTIPDTANFNVDSLDIGHFACKKTDVSDKMKDKTFGRMTSKIEDGFGNSGSSEFSVDLDNTDKFFYDRRNSTGLFFNNTKLTKIVRIDDESIYSDKYNLYTTGIEFDSISAAAVNTDYVGNNILFNTGKAASHEALIAAVVQDNKFEVIGNFAKNFFNPVDYHIDIKVGDSVYLSLVSKFWFRLEIGLLSEPTERKNLNSGKICFSTLEFK